MQGSIALLPMEKRKIKIEVDGEVKHYPGIHEVWISDRIFPRFLAPPSNFNNATLGAQSSYLELLQQICNDISWLLNAPYHQFWSQVTYSKSSIICLTSFLQDAPPAYSLFKLPKEVQQSLTIIFRLVFLVFARLSIPKESEINFITPNVLGNILYDNYIFTVPTFFDLCAIYGVSNRQEIQSMLKSVVSMQPKYLKDISTVEPHLIEVFEKAINMFNSDSRTSDGLNDIVTHVYDALVTSRIFLEVFTKGCTIFGTNQFVSSIATFYSLAIPDLTKNLKVKVWCDTLRIECIRIVRAILENVISDAVESKSMESIERYLNLISEIMSEDIFISDYHALYPLNVEFEIIIQINPDIDMMKIDYLLEALASHVDIKFKKINKENTLETQITNYPSSSSSLPQANSMRTVSGVELMSLISQVQDLLPHLGDGFIEACLKHYDYSTERVVSAVLDSTLPSHLEETNWESNRANSHNPQDLATFQIQDLEPTTAYKKKKPREHRNLNELLSDKREIKEMKDKFANLGFVEDNTYDDEYDDTYDDQDVNVREPDEVDKRRAFVVPRVLRRAEPEEEEDEDVEEPVNATVKRDHFIQNPEEIRAKAEQRRANLRGQRDVVGRAKGQGQDKQVLHNRENKNVHKASSGNHNRRDRASRKRNQGMIPS